jgi:hypothetical protein
MLATTLCLAHQTVDKHGSIETALYIKVVGEYVVLLSQATCRICKRVLMSLMKVVIE